MYSSRSVAGCPFASCTRNVNNVSRFVASGFVPKFYEDLRRKGIPVDMSIFRED